MIVCFGWFRFCQKVSISQKAFILWNRLPKRPHFTFVLLALVSSLLYFGKGMHVGEDIGGQVKSSLQWHHGIVDHPNLLAQPEWTNLAQDSKEWSLRPPGGSILPIPGLLVGLSLGDALRAGLLICMLVGGLGWIKFCAKLNLSMNGLLFLALLLGLSTGPATSLYSTANVILFSLVPWFLLWAISIGHLLDSQKDHSTRLKFTIQAASFLFLLGCFAWVKLSGIIVAGTIAAYPFFHILRKKGSPSRKLSFIMAYLFIGGLFWLPFLGLEHLNQNLSGSTANELYEAADIDMQAPLFGKHFERSTRSGWLAWSALGAPGYALPGKVFSHGFRDLMVQFDAVKVWLDQHEINEHVLFAGLLSIGFSVLLLFIFQSVWEISSPQLRLAYSCFFSLPFIGLTILSWKYGFNYLLYSAHSIEFQLIFTVPALFLLSLETASRKISSQIFLGLCIAIPIGKHVEHACMIPFGEMPYVASSTEKARGFEAREFSNAINVIEEDSQDSSDILLFLPSGDMGDLVLRTRLRSMAIHFAGDNLVKKGPCSSSEPSTVYCAYSASLKDNKAFQDTLGRAFPQATETIELTKADANDAIAIRITLEPSQKGSS